MSRQLQSVDELTGAAGRLIIPLLGLGLLTAAAGRDLHLVRGVASDRCHQDEVWASLAGIAEPGKEAGAALARAARRVGMGDLGADLLDEATLRAGDGVVADLLLDLCVHEVVYLTGGVGSPEEAQLMADLFGVGGSPVDVVDVLGPDTICFRYVLGVVLGYQPATAAALTASYLGWLQAGPRAALAGLRLSTAALRRGLAEGATMYWDVEALISAAPWVDETADEQEIELIDEHARALAQQSRWPDAQDLQVLRQAARQAGAEDALSDEDFSPFWSVAALHIHWLAAQLGRTETMTLAEVHNSVQLAVPAPLRWVPPGQHG